MGQDPQFENLCSRIYVKSYKSMQNQPSKEISYPYLNFSEIEDGEKEPYLFGCVAQAPATPRARTCLSTSPVLCV